MGENLRGSITGIRRPFESLKQSASLLCTTINRRPSGRPESFRFAVESVELFDRSSIERHRRGRMEESHHKAETSSLVASLLV